MRAGRAAAFALAALMTVAVHPAAQVEHVAATARGLVLSKTVAELSTTAGATLTDTVSIRNATGEDVKVFAEAGDIAASGNGFVYLPSGTGKLASAASWVTVSPAELSLPAGGSATVTAVVRAPGSADVGGHYAGIAFAAALRSSGAAVSAVHAMLIEIAGDGLARAGRVLSISMPAVEVNGRVPLHIRIENSGNTHFKVTGTIAVRDRLRGKTIARIPAPGFYVLPGGVSTQTIVWRSPPAFSIAKVTVHENLFDSCTGDNAASCVATASGIIVHWILIAGLAALALLIRLAIGMRGMRRRREERRASRTRADAGAGAAADAAPAAAAPAGSTWDHQPAIGGSLALRRARTAIEMLREGAGETGVRIEVALGLLRTVRDAPEVVAEVRAAYAEADRTSRRAAAVLSLALHEVDDAHAPEALLRGYAAADAVLAQRLKRALAECDPADLRAHPELVQALPASRRQTLPVG